MLTLKTPALSFLMLAGCLGTLWVWTVEPSVPRGQWGQWQTRNMVAVARDLPERADPATSLNVRWTAELGTESHGTPVVAGRHVLIGSNGQRLNDPRLRGDYGVLFCFDTATGKRLWQLAVPKVGGSPYNDWPGTGLCSSPTVEGDRVYVVTNRNELVCLDRKGMADGNDGPFRDEARYMVRDGEALPDLKSTDADVIWMLDIVKECGVHRHDTAHGSPVLDGNVLYVNTSNGVDDNHQQTPAVEAANIIAVDKRTGKLLARDVLRNGERTIHAVWSSPAVGAVRGKRLVFFGGADAVCYAFEAWDPVAPHTGEVGELKVVWYFDCDPGAPKQDIFRWQGNRQEGPSIITAMPVFHNGRLYVVAGGDYWHGKPRSWLKCINPEGSGDITRSGEIWSYAVDGHVLATPAVADGLAYVVATNGTVHCVDAGSGKNVWTHRTGREIWASPLLADGKLFLVARTGHLIVMKHGRDPKVFSSERIGTAFSGSPAADRDTLYLADMRRLFALSKPRSRR